MQNRIPRIMLVAVVCLVSTFGLTQAATAPDNEHVKYLHDAWTTENGLPQNDVTQLVQTRDGYLWLGTNGGLVRFDGMRFTIFDSGNTPELRSNRILALSEDRDGTLWIGTQNGGLTSYSQGRFRNYSTRDGLPDESIFDIEADREGNLWLSPGGLLRLTDGRFTLYTTRDGLPSNGSGDICAAPDGSIWFRSGDFIMHFQEGGFERYGIKDLPKDWIFTVSSMTVAGDGSVWLSTGYGLVRLQNGNFTFLTTKSDPNAPEMLGMFVIHAFKDRAGNLRLLTPSGLAHYQDGKVILDTPLPELPSLKLGLWTVKSVMEDREGNLWLGTSAMGLHRFRPRQVTAYTAETGLSDQGFISITDDGAGGVWIGSTDSINSLYHFQNGKFTPSNINARARSLCLDHTGTLWIGTDKGLYRLQDGRLVTDHPLNTELPFPTVVEAIYEDREGNLWVGTGTDEKLDGALYRLKDGAITKYQMSEGLVANDVRYITEDHLGALWVGTPRGMSRFKDGRFTNYTIEQGLSNNYVREIHEDADGTLWIGTYGGGLNRFKDGRFISITTKNGLFGNVVSRILEDDQGNFWMSGNRGIYRASRKELNDFADGRLPSVTSISYGVKDGMKTNETNGGAQPAGWKDGEGKLWFPTIKGVVRIDPENFNRLAPPVVVEEVLLGKTAVDPHQARIEVRPGQSDLEIRYTALSLTAAEKVRFKYKLEGYEDGWVDAGTRRSAFYTNLPPGSYRFRVIASNNDGVWNMDGAAIEVVAIPPFWKTRWFIALATLCLLGVASLVYRRRISRLKRAHGAQATFSRQLIQSQEAERKRIAAELHDGLGQSLAIIKNRAALSLSQPGNHERAIEQLDEIATAASSAIEEVREIVSNLHPYQLERLGLTKSIESMLRRAFSPDSIKLSADIDNIDELFSKEKAINLYRIVQEGVNNIVKHAAATEVRVLIKRDARRVSIVIEDNGVGFAQNAAQDVDSARRSFGLSGIAERARMLGGFALINSVQGKGTTVTVNIG